MADFFTNMLSAMKLVPKPVDDRSALSDLNESLKVDLDPAMQGFKQGLLGEKSNWEAAQKQLEVENKNLANIQGQLSAGGLDDNTLKALTQQQADTQSKIQYLQEAQKKSHENADYLRALAGRQGYDLSNYDSETNLENATLNMQADTQGIINKILNRDMTSEQYYNAAYNKLREAGATVGQARRIAAKRAGEYKADRIAKYKTAMQMFGNNGDGTMNDAMVKLMWNIMEDSPMLAEAAAKLYATPQQQYQNNFEAAKAAAARLDNFKSLMWQKQADRDKMREELGLKADYNWKADDHKFLNDIEKLKTKGQIDNYNKAEEQSRDYKFREMLADSAFRRTVERLGIQHDLDVKKFSENEWSKYESAYDFYMSKFPNAKPEQAMNYAFKNFKSAKEEKVDPVAVNILNDAQSIEDDKEAINYLEEKLSENDKMEPEARNYIREYQFYRSYLLAVKEGNEELKKKFLKQIKPENIERFSNSSDLADYSRRLQTRGRI